MDPPKSFGQALGQTGELLRGLTVPHRLLLAAGALAIGATLWVFVGWMSRPKFVTLYSGLNSQEAQDLGGRLAAANISYQLSPDGASVEVPSEQLDSARLKTASQGLPRNARLGFELFDTPNWAGSDFTEKVNYQRALEGELERTIETMSEVQSVRVHLVLPAESLFSEQEHEAKAAVIVKTRGGLSEQARIAIPQLVASAVDRLRPENVTLVDADTNTPMLRGHGVGDVTSPDLEQELAKTIVATLEPVVGAEHVRASVHIEYDTSSTEDTNEVYDPKTTATLSQQKSEETAGGAAPGGIAGTPSNTPGTAPGTAPPAVTLSSSDNQSSHSESESFAVSKDVRHTVQPAGRIRRVAAAVLVDDAIDASSGKPARRKRTPEEMKQIEQLASAAIGLDPQRNDTMVVQDLSFQETPAEQPVPPTKIERARRILAEWSALLRYAGVTFLFIFVYLMMLRPIKKQILTAFRELPGRMERGAREIKAQGKPAEIEIQLPEAAEQGKLATAFKRELTEKVKAEPASASRLVQSWIREDA
ncbi:MAG TPA: flagellar basal-body MS-ring/collar protein FliF [Terriglobales bacterium]|nr:flagellar basal-body MS-ring/collar protein FliF [Terriglobales bacterium]